MSHLSDFAQHKLDEQSGEAEDRDPRGRCPNCGCKMIIGRNGEIFPKAICPNCTQEQA